MRHAGAALAFVRAHLALVTLGVLSELVYLLYFLRQFPLVRYYQVDIDMGTIMQHTHLAFVGYIAAMTILFVCAGLAWREVRDTRDRSVLWFVLGFGAVFCVTMVFVYQVTAIDIFAYIDQSLIMVQYHQNPIFVAPIQHLPQDSLMALSDGWSGNGSPYGPLGIVIDALPTFVVGRNLLASLILLKLMFSGMALAGAYLVYQIVARTSPAHAVAGALFVAWNPLVMFEVGANGHNDIAMVLFLLLAVLSLVENDLVFAVLLLVASALVKYVTGLLIPLFLVYGITRQPTIAKRVTFLATVALASLALTAGAFLPFWEGTTTVTRLLTQDQRYLESFSSVVGYSHQLTPLFPDVSLKTATLIGRILFVPCYAYTLWLSTRRLPDLLRALFLALFFFILLGSTNFLQWYALWPVLLAATIPRPLERLAAFLMAYGTEISAAFYGYVWVWFGVTSKGFAVVNDLAYLIAFVPAAVLLALSIRWTQLRQLPGVLSLHHASRSREAT